MGWKFLIIAVSVLFPYLSFAEYNGHFIKYEMEFVNGKTVIGHSYLSDKSYMAEDVSYITYLESRPDLLLVDDYGPDDTYAYHEYRLTYKFQVPKYDSGVIFTLAEKKKVDLQKVTNIHILEMIEYSYAQVIINSLEKKDEKWMRYPAVSFWSIGDGLNIFNVFVHKENNKLSQVLNEIDAETNDYQEKVEKLENELDEMDGAARNSKEEKLAQLLGQRSQQVSNALYRLFGFKLVIIGYLSC